MDYFSEFISIKIFEYKISNNRFNRTAPFVTVCATRFARQRTNRANPLRGTGLPVKRMLAGPCGRRNIEEERH